MKISYNWLQEFIPDIPAPAELSNILTSIGLEVEKLEKYEEIKGGLSGLITGEILSYEKHPDADKLKVTIVDIGNTKTLQIVCGAKNVATGQKVIVAPVGSTIYPISNEPVIIKNSKIRGVESAGMICAEDEIGIGNSHEGIMVLPDDTKAGMKVSGLFKPYEDWIFEIGLTPNRMDAMSHLGVGKDVCAYLSHHLKKIVPVISPLAKDFKADNKTLPVEIVIENTFGCERYAGVTLSKVKVQQSPKWMQQRLKSIGLRPVNNVVDITNYVLHETGQPLHAFDADAIKGNKVIIRNLKESTLFTTLDEKERKLHPDDIMICNGLSEPMCFGGIFGGLHSGITDSTTNIFLESAWFNPAVIRKTSIRQSLRTDAAIRFEKGVDISQTAKALIHAALMIKDITGGEIASDIIDVYPNPKQKKSVTLFNDYLKKISGKDYSRDATKNILLSLDFTIEQEESEYLKISVPFSKQDVTLPADTVEEIMRIDGYDNVEIPRSTTISPAIEIHALETSYKEKLGAYLTGSGFSEIFTNSITNSAYYDEAGLINAVRIINSLSSDLDIMRPGLLETGLECIAYNLNRKNSNLLLYEFGNSYSTNGSQNYLEKSHLCLYISGNKIEQGWKEKPVAADFYFLKGICKNIFTICGLNNVDYSITKNNNLDYSAAAYFDGEVVGEIGIVHKNILDKFSIKQKVIFADLAWDRIFGISKKNTIEFSEIPKFPAVRRDLSIVVKKDIGYQKIENIISGLKIDKLSGIQLFDVFESEKIGVDNKAFAISFTFTDKEKTLIDKETDGFMNKIIESLETQSGAEIRK